LVGASLSLLVLAGCGGPVGTVAIPSPLAVAGASRVPSACRAAMGTAAALAGTEDASGSLDDAIRSCPTLAQWTLAARMFPAALAGVSPEDVLRTRCADLAGLAATPLCRELDR
jgi:hypothetical protein